MAYNSVSSATLINTTLTVGSEIILAQIGPLGIGRDAAQVLLWGWVEAQDGSTSTTRRIRIRRGTTITDPVVADSVTLNIAGNTHVQTSVQGADILSSFGTATYIITFLQGGGAAAGLAEAVSLMALYLAP